MRSMIIKGLVLFCLLLLVGCSEQSEQPQGQGNVGTGKGQLAPNFTLTDMQGKSVSLADMKGKVVLLNFWATWCPPCREEMPSMEMLHRKFKDDGLVILAVNVEENSGPVVQTFLQSNPYTFRILLDGEAKVQNLYKVFQFPETFIIDRNGMVVEKVIGAIDWMGGPAFKLINFLLKG
ncbi:TlpA disulfide reductase family protein [Malonomonas rubra]|uniref:TlpA disulfide reductase family protein n=1 Tax=Malonomonas rubra TaxID=57040 RepID=UPI0026EFBC39|nr:TlpA disulfide reductase family protein [Malonomonas rubra]